MRTSVLALLIALTITAVARADRLVDFEEALPGQFVEEWIEDDVVFTSAGPSMLLSFFVVPGNRVGIVEPSADSIGLIRADLPVPASSVTCRFRLVSELYTLTAYDADGFFLATAAVVGDPDPFQITEVTVSAERIARIEFGGGFQLPAATDEVLIVEECVADVNGDGQVGFADILDILAAWGAKGGAEDVDGDGVVGFSDVLTVLASWGAC